MDIRQLKYIAEIAACGSITKAAEKLFISQSGLNQQLFRIEDEIGAPLFERTTHSLKITDVGRVVLEHAVRAINEEKKMMSQISDIIDEQVGELHINLAMEHGIEIFCAIFPEFHERYPGISLRIEDHIVRDQYDLLLRGKLDIGMVMISERIYSDIQYEHLADERFLLGVPAGHRLASGYRLSDDGDFPLIDLNDCRNEPFSLMFSGSTMRGVIDPCFQTAGYQPDILFESRSNHVVALMTERGICLTVLPESQARHYSGIRWFRLPSDPVWESCLIYHKDNPPRRAGMYFIELAKQHADILS